MTSFYVRTAALCGLLLVATPVFSMDMPPMSEQEALATAAESVDCKLRAQGFQNTAVLWEGIQGWVSLGYPVSVGRIPDEPMDP